MPSVITIPAGVPSISIPFYAKDDNYIEPSLESFKITPAYSSSYTFSPSNLTTFFVKDDDFEVKDVRVSFNDQGIKRDTGTQARFDAGDTPEFLDTNLQNEQMGVADAGSPPAWNAGAADDHSYPISYERSSSAGDKKVTAKIEFTIRGNLEGGSKIEGVGTGPGGGLFAGNAVIGAADGNGNRKVTLQAASDGVLPTTIDVGLLEIDWKIRKKKAGNNFADVAAGQSANKIYVTGVAAPDAFHTVIDIGTRNAKGKQPVSETQRTAILNAIWSDFDNPLPGVLSASGLSMKYWGPVAFQDTACLTLEGLLLHGDGRCGAWASLLTQALVTNGVNAQVKRLIVVNPQTRLIGNPPVIAMGDLIKVNGNTAGQGMPVPAQNVFLDHAIVVAPSSSAYTYFDPSYGKKFSGTDWESTQENWENASLEGIAFADVLGNVLQIDPQNPVLNEVFMEGDTP